MVNAAQRDFWTGDVGERWARLADETDALFSEVTAEIAARAALGPGEVVLDVGCGTGGLARRAAEAVAPGGRVTGLDISPTLLEVARARSPATVSFREGDAQVEPFAPGRVDRVISRFGVMFFADTVAAFANLHRAARPGGGIVFAAWAAAEHNPWFAVPRAIATSALGPVDSDPDAPGPMRLRDVGAVCDWLRAAGWRDPVGTPVDLALTPPGTLDEVARLTTRLGGAASIVGHHGADEAARAAIAREVARAFAPCATADGVRVPARVLLFSAGA